MAVETELKLALAASAVRQVGEHPVLAGLPVQNYRLQNTYFDTPDCALAAAGVALRLRKKQGKWLMTVKRADPKGAALTRRQEWEYPARPGQFDFALVGCASLRRLLEKMQPDLQPIYTTHFLRRSWLVTEGDARIEVALDRGRIVSGAHSSPICEMELELLAGEVPALFRLASALQAHLPLCPALASKAERGHMLFLQKKTAPCKAVHPKIDAAMPPQAAFRELALAALLQLQRNVESQGWRDDPEYAHQARVALRRLRSALRLFAPVLPAPLLNDVRAWGDFADLLGKARNWDVFLTEILPPVQPVFAHKRDLDYCRTQAQAAAARAHRTLAEAFAGKEYSRLLLQSSAALLALDDGPTQALTDFARKRLQQLARQARRRVPESCDPSIEEWHRLRLALKKLRYALEFLAPLLPRKRLKHYLAQLESCLDELGQLNDLETALLLLRDWRAERRTLFLRGWLAGQSRQLRLNLPSALQGWMEAAPPWS